MRLKPNHCADCGKPIVKTSSRCRRCQMVRANAASSANKPLGDRALTSAERAQQWRDRNPVRAKQRSIDAKARKSGQVLEYKEREGCARCGISDPRVLDLHHVDGNEKIMAVSRMIGCRSWEDVLVEIKKCQVLCANCHRIAEAEKHTAQIAAAGFYRAS